MSRETRDCDYKVVGVKHSKGSSVVDLTIQDVESLVISEIFKSRFDLGKRPII